MWVQALVETSTITAGNFDHSTGGNEFALSFRKITWPLKLRFRKRVICGPSAQDDTFCIWVDK